VTLYRERFATVGMFENNPYSGIGDALAQLHDSGANLFVATSKPYVFAERIVEQLGPSQFFRAVYGSELDGSKAAKRDLIAHVLRAESLSPSETLMIGDRAHDVLGAKANGVFSIGVLWGFGSREELATAGAGVLCEEPEMLVEPVSIVNAARV
jgi:phosphoglycolate phosphatase